MSDVASLENCKELYEISGWNGDFQWVGEKSVDGKFMPGTIEWLDEPFPIKQNFQPGAIVINENQRTLPAYTADYLLDKLPPKVGEYHLELTKRKDGSFYTGYSVGIVEILETDKLDFANFIADTASDALCKLAIELFKQGILKK